MNNFKLPRSLKDKKIFFTGIKGTGMCAMAELFYRAGALVSGSDIPEIFYTDEILKDLGIPYFEGFDSCHITEDIDFIIYSSAYSKKTNPELIEAELKKIPSIEYSSALGSYSADRFSCGIAGVHGKTTTTGLTGTILKELKLPAAVLAGSGIANFGGKSTYTSPDFETKGGRSCFTAETCEYKRHFLSFHPDILVVTNIEPDHLDYYKDFNDIFSAFYEYAMKLPENGILIYCSDDYGANMLGEKIQKEKPLLKTYSYGFEKKGLFSLNTVTTGEETNSFYISGFTDKFEIKLPGKHNILNCAAAAAAAVFISSYITGRDFQEVLQKDSKIISEGIGEYRGSKRRSEILGKAGGILFMDDYAHHPTAIKKTLQGLKAFYPGKRIVADFMSHTYSRTAALLDDFAHSFENADIVILNKIYASARENTEGSTLDIDFFKLLKVNHDNAFYFSEPLDSSDFLINTLKDGDLFITMGAGDNWKLGAELYKYFSLKEITWRNK